MAQPQSKKLLPLLEDLSLTNETWSTVRSFTITESSTWTMSESKIIYSTTYGTYMSGLDRRLSLLESRFIETTQSLFEKVQELGRGLEEMKDSLQSFGVLQTIFKRTDIGEALGLLKERVKVIQLPNPELQILKSHPKELRARIIIDDSEKYFDYLDSFAEITGELHRKYDLEINIMLFQRSEIPFVAGEDIEETLPI